MVSTQHRSSDEREQLQLKITFFLLFFIWCKIVEKRAFTAFYHADKSLEVEIKNYLDDLQFLHLFL